MNGVNGSPIRGYQSIISDLGNVIVFFDRKKTFQAIAAYLAISPETLQHAVEDSELQEAYELGTVDDATFLRKIKEAIGDTKDRLNPELIAKFWGDIFWPNTEMIQMLKNVKKNGIPVILLSNTNKIDFEHIQRLLPDMQEYVDSMVLSYQEGMKKPDPNFFLEAVSRAEMFVPGIGMSEILFIDDKAEYVEAAKALGMDAVTYTSHERFQSWLREKDTSVQENGLWSENA